jgi:uncharacterized protein (TIGR02145 family)
LLYNWNAAVDTFNTSYGETSVQPTLQDAEVSCSFTENRRGICPQGWHVPSDAEWATLIDYLNSHEEYRSGGFDGYVAKALASTNGWGICSDPYSVGNNPSSNNATGFAAVSAGTTIGDSFSGYNNSAYFWSFTERGYHDAWGRHLSSCNATIGRYAGLLFNKDCGCSVRCLRD